MRFDVLAAVIMESTFFRYVTLGSLVSICKLYFLYLQGNLKDTHDDLVTQQYREFRPAPVLSAAKEIPAIAVS